MGRRHALVVVAHPVRASFTGATRAEVVRGLAAAGADVRTIDLYDERFRPEMSAEEHREHLAPAAPPDDIAPHVEALRWCDTLVLVYPTWWSGQPAMLKGWFDRVWRCGVAWEQRPGEARMRPLLRNIRRIVVVTTYGSSRFINALEGEVGKRAVRRSLRAMCHPLARTTWLALYGVDDASARHRRRFLRQVKNRMIRL